MTRQPPSLIPDYANVLISVLHHGAIACGVHKWVSVLLSYSRLLQTWCNQLPQHLVYSWKAGEEPGNEAKDEKVECDMKWEHILKYVQITINCRLRMEKLLPRFCRVFLIWNKATLLFPVPSNCWLQFSLCLIRNIKCKSSWGKSSCNLGYVYVPCSKCRSHVLYTLEKSDESTYDSCIYEYVDKKVSSGICHISGLYSELSHSEYIACD